MQDTFHSGIAGLEKMRFAVLADVIRCCGCTPVTHIQECTFLYTQFRVSSGGDFARDNEEHTSLQFVSMDIVSEVKERLVLSFSELSVHVLCWVSCVSIRDVSL